MHSIIPVYDDKGKLTGYDITLTRGDSLPLQLTLKRDNATYTPDPESEIRFAMKAR